MTDFLLITLYAPLASWGEIAPGDLRGSWDRPSRSAILGLLAASLGVRRGDQDSHDALDRACGIAIRLDAPGRPLVDYHTAQTVAASVVKRHRPTTRRELLETIPAHDRETILSRRFYRVDSLATAAVWTRAEAFRSLPDLAAALQRPRFVLYAGRKSNPFGVPLLPEVVSAGSLAEAFARRPAGPPGLAQRKLLGRNRWGREISHDPCDAFPSGLIPVRRETRRDTHPHRSRWQFRERVVEVGLATESGTNTDAGG